MLHLWKKIKVAHMREKYMRYYYFGVCKILQLKIKALSINKEQQQLCIPLRDTLINNIFSYTVFKL